jgi:hypothetical protein
MKKMANQYRMTPCLAHKKRQSLNRGPALYQPPYRRSGFICLLDEALPLSCSRLQFANCYGRSAVDASIHKVTQYHQRQHDSDHKAPSFGLSLNIDSQVTAQMLIGIVAVEIGFTGIHVSLVPVVEVVLSSIVGHDVTSLVVVYLVFALA